MNIDSLYEAMVYRGIGSGSNSRTIRWVSAEKKLANQYAIHRTLNNNREPKTVSIEFTPKKPFVIHNNNEYLSASTLVARAANASLLSKQFALPVINKFRNHFGKESRPIINFWATESDKKALAEFLKAFGYDCIQMVEDGAITYGILR